MVAFELPPSFGCRPSTAAVDQPGQGCLPIAGFARRFFGRPEKRQTAGRDVPPQHAADNHLGATRFSGGTVRWGFGIQCFKAFRQSLCRRRNPSDDLHWSSETENRRFVFMDAVNSVAETLGQRRRRFVSPLDACGPFFSRTLSRRNSPLRNLVGVIS